MTATDRPSRPRVIVTRKLPDAIEARMAELFDVTLNEDDAQFSRERLAAALGEADVLVPTLGDELDADLIAGAGERLKLLANFGAGVDHIDLAAAKARRIAVSNTPGVLTEDTADMVMALILAVTRRMLEGERLLRSGEWDGWEPSGLTGHRVGGKALGIVGMGRIGTAVARRATACRLSIHYHNRRQLPPELEEETGATYWPDLDAMLAHVDILSINTPHTPATHHLLDAHRLGLMKPSAYLVNAARGEVVVEDALVEALEAGRLAGAGLDVFEHEPAVPERLLALPNLVLLPHMGSATIEGRIGMGEKVIANIRAWVDGMRPPDQVLEGWV